MTDTKLDPATLTSEERAIVDTYANIYSSNGTAWAETLYEVAWENAEPVILARRALFAPASEPAKHLPCGCIRCTCENEIQCQGCGAKVCETHRQPAQPETAKVKCPNCGEMTERSHSRYEGPGPDKWSCQPAPPEPAKVECPNCWQLVATNEEHVSSRNRDSFTCQPAASIDTTKTVAYCDELEARYGQPTPPEPAAPVVVEPTDRPMDFNRSPFAPAATVEMPDEVDRACDLLEWSGNVNAAAALRDAWRTHAQPVAVGMTEELELVISVAEGSCEKYEAAGYKDAPKSWRAAIAAVRQQAAQPQRPKLEKVREILEVLHSKSVVQPNMSIGHYRKAYQDALAELDAAEGKGEGRG